MKLSRLVRLILLVCLISASSLGFAGTTDPLKNALEQQGFILSPGVAAAFNRVKDWCNHTPGINSALYFNNSPYLTYNVPESAGSQVMTNNIRLRPDEAILLIGPTPPPVKYFGYYPSLITRVYPDGIRRQLFATVGDAVNNATIKIIGPNPFNTPVALIFTPDQGTDARVRTALQNAGYPEGIINTVVFPASVLNLGHTEAADELRITLRTGMADDPDALNAYINNAPQTINVFRLTPSTPATPNPFPMPSLRVRGTGHTELDLMNKLGQLRQGIIAANPGLYATDIQLKPNFYEGFDYIQRWIDPWGDSRDFFLLIGGWMPEWGATDKIRLKDGEFLMFYGLNHVASGKATYQSINVYASEVAKLSIGEILYDEFTDTAKPFLPEGDPAASMMYAYKVSRKCGSQPNCMQLGVEDCPRLTLNSKTILGLVVRMYLEPPTKAGPALNEILYDRVIKFSPKKPPTG
jgi:hypothetical protein